MKDERRCPRCGSTNVKTVFELIGEKCPICKVGVIEEIETGIVA
jgi:predicted Zn-ribbon and HTH transcriptional regulator